MKDATKENTIILIGVIWFMFNLIVGILSNDLDFIILGIVILGIVIYLPIQRLIKFIKH